MRWLPLVLFVLPLLACGEEPTPPIPPSQVITVVVTATPTPILATPTQVLATPTPFLINDDKDCDDFVTWEEAQAFFIDAGGPDLDPHFLDRDGDGIACESLRQPRLAPEDQQVRDAAATATPVPEPLPTPTVRPVPTTIAIPTVKPTPTRTPIPTATLTPRPTPTWTPQPTPTPTPTPEHRTLPPIYLTLTQTPKPRPTSTPTPTIVPNPDEISLDVATLEHDPGRMSYQRVASDMTDFVMAAEFQVPYASSKAGWSVGFAFRAIGNQYHLIGLGHNSKCGYHYRDVSVWENIGDCWPDTFYTQADAWNDLGLWVIGDEADVYLNQELIGTLDLRKGHSSGDILLLINVRAGDGATGEATHFRNIVIVRLPPEYRDSLSED